MLAAGGNLHAAQLGQRREHLVNTTMVLSHSPMASRWRRPPTQFVESTGHDNGSCVVSVSQGDPLPVCRGSLALHRLASRGESAPHSDR